MTDDPNDELEDEAQGDDEGDLAAGPAVEPEPPARKADRAARTGHSPGRGPAASRGPAAPVGRTGSHALGPTGPSARRPHGVTIDPALRIRDRVSEAFVIGVVLVFAAIFLNAMAFGRGGAFTSSPSPVATEAPSGSPAASPSTPSTAAPTAAPTAPPTVSPTTS